MIIYDAYRFKKNPKYHKKQEHKGNAKISKNTQLFSSLGNVNQNHDEIPLYLYHTEKKCGLCV